jgi:hypothetical protein
VAACGGWSSLPGELAVAYAMVTAVVRRDPVVRGPDVAPVWPRRSRVWTARPGTPAQPRYYADATAQRAWEPTAVVRGGRSETAGMGAPWARPARMNRLRPDGRWSQAGPEGQVSTQ